MVKDSDGTETSAADKFPDAETVIERLGGIRPAAAKLGVPVTTVQGWKNRGRIPENRHAAILEIAARLGVDLGQASSRSAIGDSEDDGGARPEAFSASDAVDAEVTASSSKDDAAMEKPASTQSSAMPDVPMSDSASPRTEAPRSGGGLAWLSLAVALVALGGLVLFAVRPGIVAKVAESGLADLRERLDMVEATVGDEISSMKQRVERLAETQAPLSSNLADLRSRQSEAEQSATAVAEKIDAVLPRIERLESEIRTISNRIDSVQQQTASVGQEAETRSGEAITRLRADIEALQAAVSSVNSEQATVSKNLSEIVRQQSRGAGSTAALLLAIGQLESAVRSGAPFQGALERTRNIAEGQSSISEVLMQLDAWAETGVPTTAELERRFDYLKPAMAAGRTPPGGRSFLEGVWARVKETVSFRRIDTESRSPITIAERALASGDLATAISATDGFGARIENWRKALRAKMESESVLRELHERSIALILSSEASPSGAVGGTNPK